METRRGGRGSNSQSRRAPGRGRGQSTQNGSVKDAKEAFIRAISLKLGEYAQDVRKAVQDESPHVFTIQARGQASSSILVQPSQPPAPAGNVLTAAEQQAKQQHQTELAAYEAEEERVRFDQRTHDRLLD